MRNKPATRIVAILALGAVLVLANAEGWLTPVHFVIDHTLSPIGGAFSYLGNGVGDFFAEVGDIRNLNAQNTALTQEVASLKSQLSNDVELKVQNEAMRKQLNFPQTASEHLLTAQVIAYQTDDVRRFLMINRGSSDGLKGGMAVVSDGDLIGTISQVNPNSAQVLMLIDPSFVITGLDQDEPDRPTGTVSGSIGSGLSMTNIAVDETVKPGDTIISSGLGGTVPEGIIIGQVQSVDQDQNQVFQAASLTSPLNFNQLELVFVVTGS